MGSMRMVAGAAERGRQDAAALIRTHRETGDRKAIETILDMHGGLVAHLAGRHARVSDEAYEDLIQVAHVGLMKAVKNYEDAPGAGFATYAYAVVDGEIRHHLRDTQLVKKPRWSRGLYSKVTSAAARLEADLGRRPELEEIAEEVNVSPDGIVELMKLYHDTSVVSLDGAEEEGIDLSAIRSIHHESFSLPIEDRIVLEQAIESLSEIQRRVVYLFFYKDLTQTEVGKRLGLSQRKVSRLVASSVKSLRTL
ncbi:sigma-70 family RNA polymerase sigma factor [Rubrobacter tropicus]|uniref:Sigma-70 family RNA polymerase sigma factor n=1 Tax=Rubrobacter tropicus TaxID=2653851 RepID=A0A6G8Q952_9ACTN|nr:sigma-70 family RNA polymerase sigma factor [Rubrobacter tropicus]QIN82962.1 sigma-70 family RNA polymerase sigma factor [Rubrobacter tropicus]